MPHCIGHGEVEIVERGHPTGLSKVRLESGVEVEVPTHYLPAEAPEKAPAKSAPLISHAKKK